VPLSQILAAQWLAMHKLYAVLSKKPFEAFYIVTNIIDSCCSTLNTVYHCSGSVLVAYGKVEVRVSQFHSFMHSLSGHK